MSFRVAAACCIILAIAEIALSTHVESSVTLFGCDRTKGIVAEELDISFDGNCSRAEDGIDFSNTGYLLVDGNLFLTPSAGDCCNKCRETTGCRSWTWYKEFHNGRPKHGCWLTTSNSAEATGVRIILDAVSGSVGPFVHPRIIADIKSRAIGAVFEDKTFASGPYNEPELLETSDQHECMRVCIEQTNICQGWTFNIEDLSCKLFFNVSLTKPCGTCFYGYGVRSKDSGVMVELISNSCGASSSAGQNGVVFAGKPFISTDTGHRVTSSSNCCKLCTRIRECKSWSFIASEAKCLFFDVIATETISTEEFDRSGVVAPKVCKDVKFDARKGVSLVPKRNGRLHRFPADDVYQCGLRCEESATCAAWTFNASAATCALASEFLHKLAVCKRCITAMNTDRFVTYAQQKTLEKMRTKMHKFPAISVAKRSTESAPLAAEPTKSIPSTPRTAKAAKTTTEEPVEWKVFVVPLRLVVIVLLIILIICLCFCDRFAKRRNAKASAVGVGDQQLAKPLFK